MSNRTRLGDDVIMAHVDGALPEKVNEQISNIVAQDAGSRRRGQALKEVSRLAQAAYQDVLEEPLPFDLKRRLNAAEGAAGEAKEGGGGTGHGSEAQPSYLTGTPYSQRENRPDKRRLSDRQRARKQRNRGLIRIAAALALMAIAGYAGFWIGERDAADISTPNMDAVASTPVFDERILPGMAIFTALENNISGETVQQGRMAATPRMTYQDSQGRVCRQYELTGGGRAVVGVACRLPDSRWQPQMSVEAVVKDGVVRTVPGGSAALEAYLVGAVASDVLTRAQEAQLIAQGW